MDIAAKPTEYDGTVFRSKSEAIFARNLTISEFGWEYEPTYWKLPSGWGPDFLAEKRLFVGGRWVILSLLIEYKPIRPTDTYLIELSNNFKSLGLSTAGKYCCLAIADPYSDKPGIFLTLAGTEWRALISGIFNHYERAKLYRFDLKHT